MIVMALAALLCALVCAALISPFMRNGHIARGMGLAGVVTLGALSMYLGTGRPDLAAAPAAFEATGERAGRRAALHQILAIEQDLRTTPDDARKMLALGALQLKVGRVEEAISTLEKARESLPEDTHVGNELAAAYYAKGLDFMRQARLQKTYELWRKAYRLSGQDVAFRPRLEASLPRLEKLLKQREGRAE